MDGNQKPQSSGIIPTNNPPENHPSLVEPSHTLTQTEPLAPALAPSVAVAPVAPQPQAPVAPQPVAVAPAPAPAEPDAGFYHAETADEAAEPDADDLSVRQPIETVSWTSSGESQAPAKSWRVKMAAVSVVLGVAIYFITRDFFSAGAVMVAGILFGLMGVHKPRALAYQLDATGIVIGQRRYLYAEFRAFSVADETSFPTIELVPLKRFMPVMQLQMDPALHDQIVSTMSAHLPMETHRRDAIDRITGLIGKQ